MKGFHVSLKSLDDLLVTETDNCHTWIKKDTSTDRVQPNSSEFMLKCSQPQTLCCQETAPARREFSEHIADGENRFWKLLLLSQKSECAELLFPIN